jgi:hypothetical protein
MKTLQFIFTLVTAAFLAVSCTFEQEITFNTNLGGEYAFKMDLTEYVDMMSMMGGDEFDMAKMMDSIEMDSKEMLTEMNEKNGISNAVSKYDKDLKAFVMKYDFETMYVLNENQGQTESFGLSKSQYILGKNTLNHKVGRANSESKDMEEMALMGEMLKFKTKMNFPFKIKKVNNKMYQISEDGKSVEATYTFEQLMNNKGELDVEISW